MLLSSLLAVPLFLAMAFTVHGTESNPSLCEGAPWVLEEVAKGPQDEGGDGITPATGLSVATYNLHSGLGLRHAFYRSRAEVERNLRAIAGSIAAVSDSGPDIVALNEVDFGSRRSGWVDQAQYVADQLHSFTGNTYQVFRGETWRRDTPGLEVRFGNAALVRLPVLEAKACLFNDLGACGLAAGSAPPAPRRRGNLLSRLLSEPRGVIRVTVELQARSIDVLVTHLDAFDMRAREDQAALLLEHFVTPGRTTVLLGDMNAVPTSLTGSRWMFSDDRTHAILATGTLADASIIYASSRRETSLATWATYPADGPLWGLDWVLGSLDLAPQAVATIGATASDHRGLFVRYRCLQDDAELRASELRHAHICERLRAFDTTCALVGG